MKDLRLIAFATPEETAYGLLEARRRSVKAYEVICTGSISSGTDVCEKQILAIRARHAGGMVSLAISVRSAAEAIAALRGSLPFS